MVRYHDDESSDTRRVVAEEDLKHAPRSGVMKTDAESAGVDEEAARR
jgi:hypothetical protein